MNYLDYKAFIDEAKILYKDDETGHDFSHIERAINYCDIIQSKEGGDEFVVMISAIYHDMHRVLSNKMGRYVSPEESIPFVRDLLKKYDIHDGLLKRILFNIENHEDKENTKDNPIELLILKDADILDNLGETGLKRTLMYCKKKNIPIVDTEYPLDVEDYMPNIKPYSTTHYVYRTMIPNKNLISTETGRQLAEKQIKVLQEFVDKNVKDYNLRYKW